MGDEGVAEPHEQGSDSTVVTAASLRQARIDVGVQEQLGNGQSTVPGVWAQLVREIQQREPRDVAKIAVKHGELLESSGDFAVAVTLAERSDRSYASEFVLATVSGYPQERSLRNVGAHEPERLNDSGPLGWFVDTE